MAEVKSAHAIFKQPRAEPESSSQKPFLSNTLISSWSVHAMPAFLLATRGKSSDHVSRNTEEERTTKEKGR